MPTLPNILYLTSSLAGVVFGLWLALGGRKERDR